MSIAQALAATELQATEWVTVKTSRPAPASRIRLIRGPVSLSYDLAESGPSRRATRSTSAIELI
jgi:hypothetical protein